MMKGLLCAVSLCVAITITAQNIVLPDILSLEESLTRFHNIEKAAQLKAFDQTKSANWKDLLLRIHIE